jgi:enoyl-[acyl-carrier protein] reductase I
MSSSLEGRVAVVFGVANKRSIAWSIAQGLHQAGAKLAVTYQNQRLEMEAKDLILSLPGAEAFMCDVSDAPLRLFSQLKERYGELRCVGSQRRLCSRRCMKGFVPLRAKVSALLSDVSVYSLVALAGPRRR